MKFEKIKYKYLYAWDRMMGSYEYWSGMQQELAEKENAPLDAIYRGPNGWATFSSIQNKDTKERIQKIKDNIFGED